jgi:phage host-nuclease inhibitor protein Gam
MSSMPSGCHCPFNVVVMDEGHRHPHKVMFRAFADVLDKIPDGKISATRETQSPRANRESFKEKNVRAFTKQWVDLTRSKKLDDCNTENIAKKIKELKQVDGSEDEVKKLNEKLDELCGKKALQILQEKHGWPKAKDGGDGSRRPEIELLEAAIAQLRNELSAGEKTFDTCHENIKPMHLDDVEAHTWVPKATESNRLPKPLYILHYVARAKPDEDERTLKTQHVARGCWYYKVPMDENRRSQKSWLDWRRGAKEYEDGDFDTNRYIVPVATSRGKAGGLNFVENYLFHYYLKVEERYPLLDENSGEVMMQMKPSLFSIADARHQYQPNFFHETIPFFFLKGRTQVNPWVAFTQSPPFFPEQEDEQDYLDSNNSNFFRLHCMLRNCCGGVSSKGTNGTWLIKDRRTGVKGTSSIWDMNTKQKTRNSFTQLIEHRFFRESCKVEDLATSLDVIVQGKHSQYINRRLSYGMAKDPSHYLAGVQRQTEGGVVLALQTFFRKKEGTPMVWMAFTVFTLFVASLANLMYGQGSLGFVRTLGLEDAVVSLTEQQADLIISLGFAMETDKKAWTTILLDTQVWVAWVLISLVLLVASSSLSYVLHHCTCCGKRRHLRRTRFPTSMAQWARLLILLDSMTYYLWFWTAFFWIGFNYSMVFTERTYHFEAKPMTVFSWVLQALSWAMVIFATARYRMDQSMQANEVFFLSLTNLWRTTQLFYITAPLTLYSIAVGCGEFSRHRMLGVDISYWSAGDRGSISTTITKWWTLLLMLGMVAVNVIYWFNLLAFTDPISVLIVTFIGLDVVHICSFLWLGTKSDPLPNEPSATLPKWQWCIARAFQLIFSINFYRNVLRTVVFNSMFVLLLQWVGPLQHVVFPLLIPFRPELGVNQALLLLIAGK